MIPGVTILATGIGTIVSIITARAAYANDLKRASRLATAQAVIASCALANSLGNLADEWTSAPFVLAFAGISWGLVRRYRRLAETVDNRPDHGRIP